MSERIEHNDVPVLHFYIYFFVQVTIAPISLPI